MKFIKSTICFAILCFLVYGCAEKEVIKADEQIQGDWLILYPKHYLKDSLQRKIFPHIQDSIIDLFGLKTISFTEDNFIQTDSFNVHPGRWTITPDKKVAIKGGGEGFENFEGDFLGLKHDTMMIREYIKAGKEKIQVVWHFKKLTEKRSAYLTSSKANWWRSRPAKEETIQQLRFRVKAILSYYAHYYDVVGEESIYFVHKRVALPLTYFQHAIGVRELKKNETFSKLFFDSIQTATAYKILSNNIDSSKNAFPRNENFVKEYGQFLQLLSNNITNVQ